MLRRISSSKMNRVSPVLLTFFYQAVKCMWHRENVFHGCDLDFLSGGSVSNFPQLQYKIITHHDPYIPQLIDQFVLNGSLTENIDDQEVTNPQRYRFRTRIIFVELPESIKPSKHNNPLLGIIVFPQLSIYFLKSIYFTISKKA